MFALPPKKERQSLHGYVREHLQRLEQNSFFGPVMFDDKSFEETKAFARIRDKLPGVVRIKQPGGGSSNVLHLNAMREMTRRHLTYKEALARPEFTLWDRQRLADARREVNGQLLAIFGSESSIATSVSGQ